MRRDWGEGTLFPKSQIEGRVLALQGQVLQDAANTVPSSGSRELVVYSNALYEQLLSFSGRQDRPDFESSQNRAAPRVQVGGTLPEVTLKAYYNPARWQIDRGYGACNTVGAQIHGDADLMENDPNSTASAPEVRVGASNTHKGVTRHNFKPGGLSPTSTTSKNRLTRLFDPPKLDNIPNLTLPSVAPGKAFLFVEPGWSGTPPENTEVVRVPGGKARLSVPKTPSGHDSVARINGQSLLLENVTLVVDYDLTLTGCSLQGSDSSLIVNGALVVDNAHLDAGDNGLVLQCESLIMKASGSFRGLIIARRGAAFYAAGVRRGFNGGQVVETNPPPLPITLDHPPELHIRGGLLVGGHSILVPGSFRTVPPTEAGGGEDLETPSFRIHGLPLVSTKIEYDPRYLRGLNGWGNYQTLATELRQ